MKTESNIEILGTIFNSSGKGADHVAKRIQNCRRVLYGYSNVGLCYPGLNTEAKLYLWSSICVPILTYGTERVNLCKTDIKNMQNVQGKLI